MAKRKTNKGRRRGRRRRPNTTRAQAQVSASRSTARFTNRSRRRRGGRRRRNTSSSLLRRFRNPSGRTSVTAIGIAGLGILGFDWAAQKFLGNQSAPISAAVKIGGGYVLANSGSKLPLIGKHAELIGGGLVLIGVVDLLRIFVWPKLVGFFPQALLPAPPASNGVAGLINAPVRLYQPGFHGLVNVPNGAPLGMY